MTLAIACLWIGFSGDTFRYTVGWWGYAGLVLAVFAFGVMLLIHRRPPLRLRHLPLPLLMFLLWCALSVVWSHYRLETVLGIAAQWVTAALGLVLAVTLTRREFVRALGFSMRSLVYGSLVFEAAVSVFSPGGFIPPIYRRPGQLAALLGTDQVPDPIPPNFYWSHGDLFHENAIQGLPGNRNLLAMIALIALVTTLAQLWDGLIRWYTGLAGAAAAVVVIARTDSATIYVAAAFALLAAVLVAIGRRLRRRWRWLLYAAVGVGLVAGGSLVVVFNDAVFSFMDRSPDMSGRGTIWRAVLSLGQTSPILGQGWISYWAPWVPEFARLGLVDGTAYHQAHNAFLDAWMQVGTIGLICFFGVVFTTLVRTWWISVDRPDTPVMTTDFHASRPHLAATTALPFLIMVMLVVQAMTESRLLMEGNWLLLCTFAIYSKLRVQDPSVLPRRTLPAHTGPITVVLDPHRDR